MVIFLFHRISKPALGREKLSLQLEKMRSYRDSVKLAPGPNLSNFFFISFKLKIDRPGLSEFLVWRRKQQDVCQTDEKSYIDYNDKLLN